MGKSKTRKTLIPIIMIVSMVVVIVGSFAFFTDKSESRLGVGVASNTPSYIAIEYDLSLGESYVNISDEDLSRQKIRVYKGDYQTNRAKINGGFKEPDYEFEGLKSTEDLRTKLGVNTGKYTVTATQFKGTGTSNNNKGLVAVPYFDSLGLNTTDLSGMFKGASSFNQEITSWNVSNINNMDNMLEGATSFNHDLFNWETKIASKPTNFNTSAINLPEHKLPKQWQESYRVIFKDQGSTVKTITEGYHNRKLSETSTDNLDLPKEPVRDTHWFKGWESTEGIKYSKDMVMPNRDITYEAQWQKKTVEIDRGDGTTEEVEVDENGNITLPTLPDKEGEDFDGWVDENGDKVEGGTDVDYTEGDKYRPIWKPKEYTVIFKDGSEVLSTQTVKHGEDAVEPTNIKKDGYHFTGWEGSFRNVTSNVEVNTKWTLNPVVEKTFYLTERKDSNQLEKILVDNMYELVSYEVDKGDVLLDSQEENELTFKLSGRPYDRRVQTGGELIAGDSKYVSGQTSSNYNQDGYSGTLESYVYSGSYTPSDTKYVTGQTSSYYNSGGYSGSLSRYVYSGSYTPRDTISDSRTYLKTYTEWHFAKDGVPTTWSHSNHNILKGDKPSVSVTRYGRVYSGTLSYSSHSTSNVRKHRPPSGFSGLYISYEADWYGVFTGTLVAPASDTRVYRYQGNVTRPASDTRVWRYQGTVYKPEVDTRTWDNYYQYAVTVKYREKELDNERSILNIEGKDSEDGKGLEDLIERNNEGARVEESSIKLYKEEVSVEPKKEDDISN